MRRAFIGVGLAAWVGMVLACGGGGKKPEPTQQIIEAKPAKEEPTRASPDKAVRLGDLQIRIIGVSIGEVPLKDAGGRGGTSQNPELMIRLELTNANPNKKVEYQSWSGRDISFDRDYATLKDDLGNEYKRITFGIFSRPEGSVERSESIYPDKSIREVLVFQVPLDNATALDLDLPAKNYGSEGMVRFRIQTTTIRREK